MIAVITNYGFLMIGNSPMKSNKNSRQSLEWGGGEREHSVQGKAGFAFKINLHSSQEADTWMSKLRIHDSPWWSEGPLDLGIKNSLSHCIGESPKLLRERG